MSSSNPKRPPNDPKVIAEIVDKLKKQGLFDKFRKDCLADVDTKPAHQNLIKRVDTFCKNFLDNITWSPELNKNKLRDSLRNDITKSKMLSSGVDYIIGQVVNPKVQKVFKPQIDAVVCEFFGIDPEERSAKLQLREEQKSERFKQLALNECPPSQQSPGAHMGVVNQAGYTGTPNYGMPNMPGSAYMMNQTSMSTATIPGMAGISTSMSQSIQNTLGATMFPNMPPTIPNFNVPPPGFGGVTGQLSYDPSIPPPGMGQTSNAQGFPGLQQSYSTAGATGYQQVPGLPNMSYGNQVMMPGMTGADMGNYAMQGSMNTPMTASSANIDSSTTTVSSESKDNKNLDKKDKEKKKEIASLTVEDLLNVSIPSKPSKDRGKDLKKSEGFSKDRERLRDGMGRSDSGSPGVNRSRQDSMSKMDRMDRKDYVDGRRSDRSEDRRSDRSEERRSDFSENTYSEISRQERDRDKERDRDYSTSLERKRSPARSAEVKPPSPPPEPPSASEGKVYHFAWEDQGSDAMSDLTISSVHTSDLSSFDDGSTDASGLEDISSDELKSDEEGAAEIVKPPEPPKEAEPGDEEKADIKEKPRKLVALQYNYSESEDEESRDERKARIAAEKEERYLKRQLRRAELEARKEEKMEERRKKAAEKKKAETEGTVQPPEPEMERKTTTRRPRPNRTKEALKEQLRAEKREQKAQQMVIDRRMALRRQRKRNSKYMSDDFTSIFTDKRKLLSDEGYVESSQKSDPDYTPGRSRPRSPRSPSTPTQDEVEDSASDVIIVSHEPPKPLFKRTEAGQGPRQKRTDDNQSGGRPLTPFSDTSDTSKMESDISRGRRRRRTLSGRHSPEPEEKKQVRQHEAERAHSQRYDDSDLYKPHTSYRTRRRGTSPVLKDPQTGSGVPGSSPPRAGFGGRRGSTWAGNTPPMSTRGGRPPSPPSGDEHRQGAHWSRQSNPESFKQGRSQPYSSSPERPTKVPKSPEARPGMIIPRDSSDQKAGKFHPGSSPGVSSKPIDVTGSLSGSDDGSDKRERVPIFMVSFGEAAKHSRQKKPRTDDFAQFGEAARQTRNLVLQQQAIRGGRRTAPQAAAGIQRPFRRGGESFRGTFQQETFQRSGSQGQTSQAGSPRSLGGPVPIKSDRENIRLETDQPVRLEELRLQRKSRAEQEARVERGARPDRSFSERWSRNMSQDEDDWQNIPKPKPLEQEKEEWEPISDDEDLGDSFEEGQERVLAEQMEDDQLNKHPGRGQVQANQDQSLDSDVEKYRERSDDSADDQTQVGPPRESRKRQRSDESPRYHQPRSTAGGSDLEEGEEYESPVYQENEQERSHQPPEPPEEVVQSRKLRSVSTSSGELKEDDGEVGTELPKAGMSPTAKLEQFAEMPRPGLSPSERELDSPSRSVPRSGTRSPSRSVPRSPTRSAPSIAKSASRSPTRSLPRSPTRSIPRSPQRSGPRTPTRSVSRSPTRSIPRSPTMSGTRSPRSGPRTPKRSMSRSPTRPMPRSPTRSVKRSPSRSVPRSPSRSLPRSPPRSRPRTPPRPRSPRRSLSRSEGEYQSSNEDSYALPDPHEESIISAIIDNVSSPESGEVDFDSDQETPRARTPPARDNVGRSPSPPRWREKETSRARTPPTQGNVSRSSSPPRRQEIDEHDASSNTSASGPSRQRRPSTSSQDSQQSGTSLRGDGASSDRQTSSNDPNSPHIPKTRLSRKRTEEEALPIAKRLRR